MSDADSYFGNLCWQLLLHIIFRVGYKLTPLLLSISAYPTQLLLHVTSDVVPLLLNPAPSLARWRRWWWCASPTTATPPSSAKRRIHIPRWVGIGLGVTIHIGVGVHALHVALYRVGRKESTTDWVVVTGVVVVEAAEWVDVLAGVAFVGVHAALAVVLRAVRAVDLVALHCGTVLHIAERGSRL